MITRRNAAIAAALPLAPALVGRIRMQTFASTIEMHLICSKEEADHVRSVPVRR